MNSLTDYQWRLQSKRGTSRDRWLNNTHKWLRNKLPASLSYFTVTIDGEERECAIVSSRSANEKTIISMPGETLKCGAYVEWMDNIWIITSLDPANEVYQSAKMLQCNYLLKWVNDDGEVVSRWVTALDGTKYLTGEYAQQVLTLGDSRLQMTMPRDNETVRLNRGFRFLIDDPDATEILAYELTKVNRSSSVYNGDGVFVHMLTESNREDKYDNYDLMIANYYDRIGKFAIKITNANSPLSLNIGNNFMTQVSVFKDGQVYNGAYIEYVSSDTSVATVSKNGEITAVSAGTCEVSASYLTFSTALVVNITEQQTESPAVSKNYHIALGDLDSLQYALVGSDISFVAKVYEDGNEISNVALSYSLDCSSDVATIKSSSENTTIHIDKNRKNIGTRFIVTVTCDQYDISASKELIVKGWS